LSSRQEFALSEVDEAYAAVLSELHAAAFAGTTDAWSADAFVKLMAMPGAVAWLATDREQIPAGFALARTGSGECEIIVIGVDPGVRRCGVGERLLDRILSSALQAQVPVILEVAADNIAAISLYDASGFVEAGRRRHYYRRSSGPVDALILRKDS